MTTAQLVSKYSNAVGRFGPDSQQAKQLKEANAANTEFLSYANALDRIKRHLRGSGIDCDFDKEHLDRHNLGFKGA